MRGFGSHPTSSVCDEEVDPEPMYKYRLDIERRAEDIVLPPV